MSMLNNFCYLGDSRALLSYRNGKYIATKDHKPTSPTERKRIKEAGSAVINGRVGANLALSRGNNKNSK
jgi:protein phosphatase PTC2/3